MLSGGSEEEESGSDNRISLKNRKSSHMMDAREIETPEGVLDDIIEAHHGLASSKI